MQENYNLGYLPLPVADAATCDKHNDHVQAKWRLRPYSRGRKIDREESSTRVWLWRVKATQHHYQKKIETGEKRMEASSGLSESHGAQESSRSDAVSSAVPEHKQHQTLGQKQESKQSVQQPVLHPHRCNDRIEDLVQALFEGNLQKSVPSPARLLWRCMRSRPGEEPTEPFLFISKKTANDGTERNPSS